MPISLQDQLKKSGLVDEKKAKQLKRAKQKAEKQNRTKKRDKATPANNPLSEQRLEQIRRDKELNEKRNLEAQQRAVIAQVKQLIQSNLIRHEGDSKYSFPDAGVIKQLWVSDSIFQQLSRGRLSIVRVGAGYGVVATAVAEKIAQRAADTVVFTAAIDDSKAIEEDDPYADYQIPDDLMW